MFNKANMKQHLCWGHKWLIASFKYTTTDNSLFTMANDNNHFIFLNTSGCDIHVTDKSLLFPELNCAWPCTELRENCARAAQVKFSSTEMCVWLQCYLQTKYIRDNLVTNTEAIFSHFSHQLQTNLDFHFNIGRLTVVLNCHNKNIFISKLLFDCVCDCISEQRHIFHKFTRALVSDPSKQFSYGSRVAWLQGSWPQPRNKVCNLSNTQAQPLGKGVISRGAPRAGLQGRSFHL